MKFKLKTIIKFSLFSLIAFNSTVSHATDALNDSNDCESQPISHLGYEQLSGFSEYNDNKTAINQALIYFCKKGANATSEMGFPTFQPLAIADVDKWSTKNLPHQSDMNERNIKRIKEILVLAALNGFTGLNYPKPPEDKSEQQSENKFQAMNNNQITQTLQKKGYPSQSSNTKQVEAIQSTQMLTYCSSAAESAGKKLVSQLPQNVTITVDDWNKIKQQLAGLCFSGFTQGVTGKPLLSAFEYGLGNEAKDLYEKSYIEGLKHPEEKNK